MARSLYVRFLNFRLSRTLANAGQDKILLTADKTFSRGTVKLLSRQRILRRSSNRTKPKSKRTAQQNWCLTADSTVLKEKTFPYKQ